MNNKPKMFLSFLIMLGVLATDADVVKTISAKEGDSVTLNLDPTEMQGFNGIQWRFGYEGSRVARMVENESSYTSDDIFRDRLELNNQTGSLTIKNMRTKHSGLYKAELDHMNVTSSQIFIVTVYESPSDAGKAEINSLSVMEGDSAVLHTDVTELRGDELMVWRFGDKGKLIAKRDTETNSSSFIDTEERFIHRLELDQTGSLTIKNTRNSDSGLYIVKISSNKDTVYKKFSIAVSVLGLSPGSIAGIVVSFLLLLAVSVIGASCYRSKISELRLRTYEQKTVMVKLGDDVTLQSDAHIMAEDHIIWTFENRSACIAEIKQEVRETFDAHGIFTDRLMLDETASLTIRNTGLEHYGYYVLKVKRIGGFSFYKRFHVVVSDFSEEDWRMSVMEGDDVTLNSGTKLNENVHVKWLFGEGCLKSPIAEISGATGEILTYDGNVNGRFRDRLKLDHQTGSLTIINTGPEDSGSFEIQTMDRKGINFGFRMVSVNERRISVEEGKNVTLEIESEIQNEDQILWMFGVEETLVAQIRGGTIEIRDDAADGRFANRLKLEESGSLAISNITAEHTGAYKAQIISLGKTSYKKFKVVMPAEFVPVRKGDNVTLHTDYKVKADDQVQWTFGPKNSLIAEMNGESGEITMHDGVRKGRFKDGLMLEKETGSLTITNITTDLSGVYKMKISRSAGTSTNKSFNVFATDSAGKEVIESATVDMQLLNEEAPVRMSGIKGTSSL
ncbi:uncharacterized protein LOC130216035 [Danio aesculapii]|uniref:uncharacterized protein LOC130216035 n=1 Tax=Danio aesculapii TaxID=1142201 RepID=UPI0024C0CB8A|nr:uncharacterized protein LOC130216035 [Danio aesculapii]